MDVSTTLASGSPRSAAHHKNQRHDGTGDGRQAFAQIVELALQRCLAFLHRLHHANQPADLRGCAGCRHKHFAASASHHRMGEDEVGAVRQGRLGIGQRRRRFVHG